MNKTHNAVRLHFSSNDKINTAINVTASNNRLVINNGTADTAVSLNIGFYNNPQQFADMVNTVVATVANCYAFLNSSTNIITFAFPNASHSLKFTGVSNSAESILGFAKTNYTPTLQSLYTLPISIGANNNTFVVNNGTSDITITIPSDLYYTLSAFQTAINNALSSAGLPTVAVIINSTTGILTFSTPVSPVHTVKFSGTNSAAVVMGFVNTTNYAATAGVVTSPSSVNIIATTIGVSRVRSNVNPQFNVDLERILDTFDEMKPTYIALENFVCQTNPTAYIIYSLIWNNMPARQWASSTAFNNVIGTFAGGGNGNARMNNLTSDTMGIPVRLSSLTSMKTWEFSFRRVTAVEIDADIDLGSYMFSMLVWQRPDDSDDPVKKTL